MISLWYFLVPLVCVYSCVVGYLFAVYMLISNIALRLLTICSFEQVHSEAYLNCLKKSANVAMIIEVMLIDHKLDFGLIGHSWFVYSEMNWVLLIWINGSGRALLVSYMLWRLWHIWATMIKVPHVAVFPNCLVQQKVLYPFRNQVTDNLCCVLSFQSCCQRGKENKPKRFALIIFHCRWGELSWLQSLQKSEDGPSMWGEGFIIALGKKEGDSVLMQIFLFAYTLPLSS